MEIRTQEEFERARQFRLEIGYTFWLGANDIQAERNWVWNSNEEVVNLDEFWYTARPTGSSGQNCLVMDAAMFDGVCHEHGPSVCEYIN